MRCTVKGTTFFEKSERFGCELFAALPLALVYIFGITYVNSLRGDEKFVVGGYAYAMQTMFGFVPVWMGNTILLVIALWLILKSGAFPTWRWLIAMAVTATYFAVLLNVATPVITTKTLAFFGLIHPGREIIFAAKPIVVAVVKACGAGFFEELLARGAALGGILFLCRFLRVPDGLSRVTCVLVTSILFSGSHFVGVRGDDWNIVRLLYLSNLGACFSYVYLRFGFATAAWSHAIYDVICFLS